MKKYLAMLLACAMIFAFAAGCAQQNPANSDEPTATNAPTDVEATPVQNTELVTDGNETVSDKDTINIAVDREPATLNPGGVSSNVNEKIMRNVLDTLLKFDENAIPQTNLATEWEAVDDLTWQFKLRDDVNFTNGEHFTAKDVVYSINRLANTTNNMFAEMLQSMWAEVGVTLVLQPTESGTLSTMLNAGDYEVGTAATDMKLCDAGEGLYAFFHSSSRGSSQDRTWLNDADVDAILDKIVTTLDAEERNKLVSEAEAMIHDLCPMIYICQPWRVYGARSDVRGLKVLPYDMEYYSKLYFVNED